MDRRQHGSLAYRKSGFTKGDSIPHLVGHEYDRAWTEGAFAKCTPQTLQIISRSPVRTDQGEKDVSHTAYHTSSSGAGVFAAGTIRWTWGLDGYGTGSNVTTHFHNPGVVDPRIQTMTETLLRVFSEARAHTQGGGPRTASFSVAGATGYSALVSPTMLPWGSRNVAIAVPGMISSGPITVFPPRASMSLRVAVGSGTSM